MFKVGDKVRAIVTVPTCYNKGDIFTVIREDKNILITKFYSIEKHFSNCNFELVSSSPNNPVAANPLSTTHTPLKSHHRENVMGCECGAYAVKDHFHSTWCPVSKVG